jgi:Zn-dependent protease
MSDAQRDDGRPSGIPLGRVLGVPVYVSVSTLLLVVVIAVIYSGYLGAAVPTLTTSETYLVAVAFAVLLIVSVFLHELGHCVLSQAVGVPVHSITLWMLGGVTATEGEARDPGRTYLIGVAGPLVSLFLAGVGALVTPLFDPGTVSYEIAAQLTVTTLLVTAFNLLPGLPLDGGQLLRAGVWKLTGDKHTGTKAAAWVGRGVAVAVVLAALLSSRLQGGQIGISLIFSLFIALFIWQGASQAL